MSGVNPKMSGVNPKINKTTAEKLYNNHLKHIEKYHTGKNTTYMDQLTIVGRKLFGVKFKGVYPSDMIPKLTDLSPYCILNLDKSDEPGSHWISLVKCGKNKCLCYDSFGRCYTQIIPNLEFSGNGQVINTDKDSEQTIKQKNCGSRCLSFISIYDKYGEKVAKMI